MVDSCQGLGIVAYSKSDLLPHGFIFKKITRIYPEGESPTDAELANPENGQSFRQIYDPSVVVEDLPEESYQDIPILWEETRKQLPSTVFTVNFQYRTRSTSDNLSLGAVTGDAFNSLSAFSGGLGTWGAAILNSTFTGGITNTNSKIIWQTISSQTLYDIPVVLTEESKKTGVIEAPGWISALVGVFSDPLNLSDETKLVIGTSDRDFWNFKGIQNDADGNGIWRGAVIDGIGSGDNLVSIFPPSKTQNPGEIFDAKNRVHEVVRDDRAISFLSDNAGVPDQPYGYSYDISSYNTVIFNQIKINTNGLKAGDTVYITANLAKERYFREKMYHRASLAELGTADGAPLGRSGGGNIYPISSKWEIYHSHIVKTRVKSGKNIPLSADVLNEEFINKVKPTIKDVLTSNPPTGFEDLESWRLSSITGKLPRYMFFGDMNGIHRVALSGTVNSPEVNSSELILPKSSIKDINWYNQFLLDNVLDEFDITVVDSIDKNYIAGLLFDISLQNNILLDKEKTGYQRELAEAIMRVGSNPGIGIPNLDLVVSSQTNVETQFDLSSAKFKSIGNTSKYSGAWDINTCFGDDFQGSYYDPNDPANEFTIFYSLPAGDLVTDWRYSTPVYDLHLDNQSRIYVELFQPGGLVDRRYSLIFPKTVPFPESSLSLDFTSDARRCFTCFQNVDKNAVAYYSFYDGDEERALHAMTPFPEGNHIRPDFNHDEFKFLGYNIAAGDTPSYSEGQIISGELAYICDDKIDLNIEDIYQEETWLGKEIAFSFGTYEIESNVELDKDKLYRDIILSYEVDEGFESIQNTSGGMDVFKNGTKIGDNFISIEFVDSNQIIDNIRLSVYKGVNQIILDGKFYGSGKILLHGDMISEVKWRSILATFTTESKIKPFWISSAQTAIGIDGRDYIHIFYHDVYSGNISCVVSDTMGLYWYNFKDIIRLVKGELADQPYVITDKDTNTIHLFYRLNSQYLMVKSIDTNWFVCEDQFESYIPLEDFNEDTDDLLGIKQYSKGGQSLRRQESYFVHGNSDNAFVKRQQSISEKRLSKPNIDEKTKAETTRSYRFLVDGGLKSKTAINMTSDYEGMFCVFKDNRGNYRSFFTSIDGKMSIKVSPDLKEWLVDVKDMWIHKDFWTDKAGIDDLSVSNPQVVHDQSSGNIYLFYFHKKGIYFRRFSENIFYPIGEFLEYANEEDRNKGTNEDGSFSAAVNFRTELEITEKTPVYPVFTIGELSKDVSEASRDNDSNLVLTIPFKTIDDTGQIVFDEKFGVDVGTKPVGYIMRNGVLRLFYRTQQGLNYALSINGDLVILDAQLRYTT